MAKIVCSNCGYKNKASTMICSNCGNLLSEPQTVFKNPESVPEPAGAKQNNRENEQPVLQTGSNTINVSSRKGWYRWTPQIVSGGILIAFVLLEYLGMLPPLSFYVLLAVIFLLPSFMRGIGNGISFNAYGFRVKNKNVNEFFNYNEIENARIDDTMPGFSSLILSFSNNKSPVTMNFDSVGSFRMLLMQLRRRRVPILEGSGDSISPSGNQNPN